MTSVIIEVIDLLVGHQVAVVEEQTVDTQTQRQLQFVGGVPLILHIAAQLIEGHTGSGIRLTTVTVSQTDDLRSCAIQEVIQ